MTDIQETFGGVLRRARQRAGLTQQQLADFATVSVRTVRDLETGRSQLPRRGTVALLAKHLRLSRAARARFEDLARATGREQPVVQRGLAAEIAGIWHSHGDPVVWLTPAELSRTQPEMLAAHALVVLDGVDEAFDHAEEVVRLLRGCPGLRVVTTANAVV